MIKIPLFRGKSLGFERDMVAFSLKYGSLPRVILIAIVDTGCPYVIISENIIKKTRIPYTSKPSEEKPVQLGPILLELRNLGVCELFFKDDKEEVIEPFQQEVFVGIPILKKNQIICMELLSFIGKSFFDKHCSSIVKKKDGSSYMSVPD